MIQRRTILLVVLALFFGGVATWVAYNRVSATDARAEVETVPVVVAAFDIDTGNPIDKASLRTVAWTKDSVPDDALHDVGSAAGKFASQPILRGDAVTKRRLVDERTGSPLAHLIQDQKRAVTVRVDDVIGVAGFLLPSSRVDVLASRPSSDRRRVETRTLLENLKVLAVDQQARPNKDDPVLVRAVTLEVDPTQAEALVKATQEGTVQLALRNPTDEVVVSDNAPVQVKRRSSRPSTTPVTVIRGTTADVSDARF